MIDAHRRMDDTDLPVNEGTDISRVIRRVVAGRTRIMADLHTLMADLEQVAVLLRQVPDAPGEVARTAREHIAVDFSTGSEAVERARQSLEVATKDLEYLRYVLL